MTVYNWNNKLEIINSLEINRKKGYLVLSREDEEKGKEIVALINNRGRYRGAVMTINSTARLLVTTNQ